VGSGFTAQSDVIKDNPEKGYSQVGFDRDALDSVVFGVSTTEEDRANITDIVRSRYPAVKLFQAHTNAASHKLDIVPVVTESDGRI
jgi:hypothetical protein